MAPRRSHPDPYGASLKSKQNEGKALFQRYDWLMESAAKHDAESINKALSTLEASLDIQAYPALVVDLIKIYAYIRWCAERGNYAEICRVVETLKEMWEQALSR